MGWAKVSETRHEYVPVGSSANVLFAKVSKTLPNPYCCKARPDIEFFTTFKNPLSLSGEKVRQGTCREAGLGHMGTSPPWDLRQQDVGGRTPMDGFTVCLRGEGCPCRRGRLAPLLKNQIS